MADYGRPLEFAQVSAAGTKAAVGAVVWRAREGIKAMQGDRLRYLGGSDGRDRCPVRRSSTGDVCGP